jgi:AbrB family looped-hinge helix DNA binding protein
MPWDNNYDILFYLCHYSNEVTFMDRTPVRIGEGGRIVIPSEFRKALGIDIGDELILHMENGKIILMTRKQAIEYVQEQMSKYSTGGRVLSEELIAERKEEAGDE